MGATTKATRWRIYGIKMFLDYSMYENVFEKSQIERFGDILPFFWILDAKKNVQMIGLWLMMVR